MSNFDNEDKSPESGVSTGERDGAMDDGKLEDSKLNVLENARDEFAKVKRAFSEDWIDSESDDDNAETNDEIAPAREDAVEDMISTFDDKSETMSARLGMEEAAEDNLEKKDWSCIVTSDTEESVERREDEAAESLVAVVAKYAVTPPPPPPVDREGREKDVDISFRESSKVETYDSNFFKAEDIDASKDDGRNWRARFSNGEEESVEMDVDR